MREKGLGMGHPATPRAVGAGILLLALLTGSAGGVSSLDRFRLERAQLDRLVELAAKDKQTAQLIPLFKELAGGASAETIRREASFHLGVVYAGIGRSDKAGEVYDALSRLLDDLWGRGAAVALGDLRRKRGDLDGAAEAYERILRRNRPEREAVVASLGVALVLDARGRVDEAIEALEYGRDLAGRLYDEEDRKSVAGTLAEIDAALARLRRARDVAGKGEAAVLLEEANAALARSDFGTALGKYGEILDRFADSKEADEAGYRKGLALYLSDRPVEAGATWTAFVDEKSDGPWRGHALVGLADVRLEHDLDPVSAEKALDRYFKGVGKGLAGWNAVEGDAWLRKAVVEYISNRRDGCLADLDRAQCFRPAPEVVARCGIPWGPGRLAEKLRSGEEITPASVRAGGSPQARTALVLGDLYFEMMEHTKAQALFRKLNPPLRPISRPELAKAPWRTSSSDGEVSVSARIKWLAELAGNGSGEAVIRGATPAQSAYARLEEGWVQECQCNFEGALPCYAQFVKNLVKTPWAPRAVLRGGAMVNQMNPAGSDFHEAMMGLFIEKWPKDKSAPTAALWYAVAAWHQGKKDEARARLRWAVRKYPIPAMKTRAAQVLRQWEEATPVEAHE